MPYRTTTTSTLKSDGPGGSHASDAPDVFNVASSVLAYQQHMHGLSSLTADAMKLMLRQTQMQMEYMHALSRCRDLPSVGAVMTEFAQKMGEEISAEWQEVSQLAERWMASASQTQHHMMDAGEAIGRGPDRRIRAV